MCHSFICRKYNEFTNFQKTYFALLYETITSQQHERCTVLYHYMSAEPQGASAHKHLFKHIILI